MNSYKIFQDWTRNSQNFKGQFVMVNFRFAAIVQSSLILKFLFFWYLIYYRIFVIWILGVELPWNLKIGKGLQVFHGQALVVNGGVILGENCVLRHSTTIGNKTASDDINDCPKIGNNVDVGANSCILGKITIGDNVVIGAGSIVIKDIPSNCVVVGNPSRIIKYIDKTSILNQDYK